MPCHAMPCHAGLFCGMAGAAADEAAHAVRQQTEFFNRLRPSVEKLRKQRGELLAG